MSRTVNYFLRNQVSASGELTGIVQLACRYVPILLNATEGHKARSFWATTNDWQIGYSHICKQQAEFLMDAKEELIVEIRGVRGPVPPATAFDLTTYPVGSFPGFTLGTIDTRLHSGGTTVAQKGDTAIEKLEAIRLLLAEQGTDTDSIIGMLDELLLLLAV